MKSALYTVFSFVQHSPQYYNTVGIVWLLNAFAHIWSNVIPTVVLMVLAVCHGSGNCSVVAFLSVRLYSTVNISFCSEYVKFCVV